MRKLLRTDPNPGSNLFGPLTDALFYLTFKAASLWREEDGDEEGMTAGMGRIQET